MKSTIGLHHITAIAGDPQENLDFYVGVLGMRLAKKSINQDVPDTYHLFFADDDGNPGTDLTFFPWPTLPPRRDGIGHWGEISLTVPDGALGFWEDRLGAAGVEVDERAERFGEIVLPFRDPHGLRLSLVESEHYDGFAFTPRGRSTVAEHRQIRGFAGVRLEERQRESTEAFFANALGFRAGETDGEWTRFYVGEGRAGQRIDLRVDQDARRGNWGVGAVHHVAWRVSNDEDQLRMREQVMTAGGRPTQVIDRFWFRSVYVQEPGGALVELATDGPGFAVDEDPAHLGETLVLPPWYEEQRDAIEQALPPLRMPEGVVG
ncbi:MAG: ring-cleaving dioxygenase [Spirochaetota bacterium]